MAHNRGNWGAAGFSGKQHAGMTCFENIWSKWSLVELYLCLAYPQVSWWLVLAFFLLNDLLDTWKDTQNAHPITECSPWTSSRKATYKDESIAACLRKFLTPHKRKVLEGDKIKKDCIHENINVLRKPPGRLPNRERHLTWGWEERSRPSKPICLHATPLSSSRCGDVSLTVLDALREDPLLWYFWELLCSPNFSNSSFLYLCVSRLYAHRKQEIEAIIF